MCSATYEKKKNSRGPRDPSPLPPSHTSVTLQREIVWYPLLALPSLRGWGGLPHRARVATTRTQAPGALYLRPHWPLSLQPSGYVRPSRYLLPYVHSLYAYVWSPIPLADTHCLFIGCMALELPPHPNCLDALALARWISPATP